MRCRGRGAAMLAAVWAIACAPPALAQTAAGSAANTQRLLVRNGVEADLQVWDGLDHAFFLNTDMPQSREAFDVMVAFFQRHLGARR